MIPHDLKNCPYVILVSKGVHSHPPPLPARVPINIRTRLQQLIDQASSNALDITPTQIITGILNIKYYSNDKIIKKTSFL